MNHDPPYEGLLQGIMLSKAVTRKGLKCIENHFQILQLPLPPKRRQEIVLVIRNSMTDYDQVKHEPRKSTSAS